MIQQSLKKKGKTKTNKNTNFVYDIDYNHYRKRDQNNKKNKIKKNVEPNYSSKDKRIQPKKLTAKVDEYKTSHQNSQVCNLFNKYKTMNYKQNPHIDWRRLTSLKKRQQQQIGLELTIHYKKLRLSYKSEKSISLSRRQINKTNLLESLHKSIQSQDSNDNQRITCDTQNLTKLTHCTSSTKTNSNAFFRSNREYNTSYSNRKLAKNQSLSTSINNKDLKILPNDLFNDPIPQEQNSQPSQIKTSKSIKNQSNLTPSSHLHPTPSLKTIIKSSVFLPLNSNKSILNEQEIYQQQLLQGYAIVQKHIQNLNILAGYSQQITQNYQNTEDWQQLIFLMYKKYYLARIKLFNALQYRNVLFFQNYDIKLSSTQKRSLKNFMNSEVGQNLKVQIFKQNSKISGCLRNLYNIIIEKSGNYINLQQTDNFSCQIFKIMVQQIQELKKNYHLEPDLIKVRLKNVLKCAIVIANLDKKIEETSKLNQLYKSPVNIRIFQEIILFIKQRLS